MLLNGQVGWRKTEMNKKVFSKIIGRNLNFAIVTLFTLLIFINQLVSALSTIEYGGQLNSFKYSVIMIELDVTNRGYNNVYEIGNYPLIPIVAGVIYNIYIYIKVNLNKDKAA